MTDRLNPGDTLGVGDSLVSASGQFSLVLQADGNLVLYEGENMPVWASGTNGQEVATGTLQDDGNLVLSSATGDPMWSSETNGNGGAYLVLQDDRNVVIYSADGNPIWATNTSA